jgi:hypothetical protein
MRLPEKVFFEIVRSLGSGSGSASRGAAPAGEGARGGFGADRRADSRRRLDAMAAYSAYGSIHRTELPVTLDDLSTRGVGLVLRDSVVAPGEQIVLHASRGEAETLDVLCTVRSAKVLRDGRFRVGAEFSAAAEPAATDHAHAVVSAVGGSIRVGDSPSYRPRRAQALWGSTASRRDFNAKARERRDERVILQGRGVMCVYRSDGTSMPEERVLVWDLSAGGVGISRPEPLVVGEQFVIRVPRVDEKPVTRLCAVTRAVAAGDRFTIGARFIPFGSRRGRGWLARVFDWVA